MVHNRYDSFEIYCVYSFCSNPSEASRLLKYNKGATTRVLPVLAYRFGSGFLKSLVVTSYLRFQMRRPAEFKTCPLSTKWFVTFQDYRWRVQNSVAYIFSVQNDPVAYRKVEEMQVGP